MDRTDEFEAERPRLVALAARVLGERAGAQDVVQQAWLRLHGTDSPIESVPAWLTTVTTRLCLDQLRARTAEPRADVVVPGHAPDPAEDVALAETVGIALHVVLDRLTPAERVAFVLHDSFGFGFPTIAAILATTPAAARKLASRARAKVSRPRTEDRLDDWEIVDAFMAAAREGDFAELLQLLAPDADVVADPAAVLAGTPERIEGRHDVATFFRGSAHAALPVFTGRQPGAAWYHRGRAMVLFDFTIGAGRVRRITFRAEPEVLARVRRRSADSASDAPPQRTNPHTQNDEGESE